MEWPCKELGLGLSPYRAPRHNFDILPQGLSTCSPCPGEDGSEAHPSRRFFPLPHLTSPEPDASTSSFRTDFPSASIPAARVMARVGPASRGGQKATSADVLECAQAAGKGAGPTHPRSRAPSVRPQTVYLAQQKGRALAKSPRRPGRVSCSRLVWTPSGPEPPTAPGQGGAERRETGSVWGGPWQQTW